jgi:hypothetical protein
MSLQVKSRFTELEAAGNASQSQAAEDYLLLLSD